MKIIDLRSDTVTRPSKGMMEAIMNAELGDDVFGEDPTVNKLQEKCAVLSGKEKALFVTSGCLGNQLAIKSHTNPGDEVICETDSHIFNYETSAPSIISHVQLHTVKGKNGVMSIEDVKNAVRSNEYYFPVSRLLCFENTHNRAGGTILPVENLKELSGLARANDMKVHIDGARIFNACAETRIALKEYASYADSISFCFSKGLGAPAGSVLCGSASFIERAHKWRKILGGGMRQAGILAAAALYALENNVVRLKEDHKKAKYFAEAISKNTRVEIDLNLIQTNIILFRVKDMAREEFILKLSKAGVLVSAGAGDYIRAVSHLDVSSADIENAAEIFNRTV
ncbi:MAG: low-specificity L-threonine aldolase [Ignavibacteria bacterium]|nr:low-specificity L-threonine aldolase [Ignavibacteria bacterium]